MIKFKDINLKVSNRHGAPHIKSPKEYSTIVHFPYYSGEGHIDNSIGGREITVDAFLVDLTFIDQKKVYDYIDNTLKPLINKSGKLEIDCPGTGTQKVILEDCVFKPWELVPQPGQQQAVPMPDVITYTTEPLADRVGPGSYYIEILLRWYQLLV